VVEKPVYDEYVAMLEEINWEATETLEEITDEECATGACPVK
jgi:hypothetical protein